MLHRRRILLLVLLLITVAAITGTVAIATLYQTAFSIEGERLAEVAHRQARLIEASLAQGDTESKIITRINQAYSGHNQIRKGSEVVIARRNGDRIDFLAAQAVDNPKNIPDVSWSSPDAEPMRRALMGRSDICVALDYRGQTVIAAHEPVAGLGWGVVVKMNLSEVRAPFIKTGLIIVVIGALMITLGAILVFRVADPVLQDLNRNISALSESEQKFSTLFSTMTEGVALHELVRDDKGQAIDYRIVDVNPAYFKHIGLSAETVRGRLASALYGAGAPPYLDLYTAVAQGGAPSSFEVFFPPLAKHFLISVFSPGPDHFVTVFTDISERKQAENEIKRLNLGLEERVKDRTSQLEASHAELEAFSYSVSHDLRAPLRHIHGFIDMLREHLGPLADPTASNHLKVISQASQRMGQLIDNLLAFSRLGRSAMRLQPCDLESLVHESIADLERDSVGRTIHWQVAALPTVSADLMMLRQVFANLLGNAIKYTRHCPVAEIAISASSNDTEVTVTIRDNGAGFDMNYSDKLFGVFQRLHSDHEFEGTGIGLAHVRRIITRHGGRTWAEGVVGAGATFFFTLPIRKEANP